MLIKRTIFKLFRTTITYDSHSIRLCSSIYHKEFKIKSDFFDNLNINQNLLDDIVERNKIRKSRGSIELLQHLFKQYSSETIETEKNDLKIKLLNEIKKFPNETHPTVLSYGYDSQPVELYTHGDLHKNPIENARTYEELGTLSNTIRMSQLGNFTGSRSYYFMHSVAEMEQALIRYTTDALFKEGFELISVPDILPAEVIEGCGMETQGDQHQVYSTKYN